MGNLPIRKLGPLMAEAVELVLSVCTVDDVRKLDRFVASETDHYRALVAFLVLMELTGADRQGRLEIMRRGTSLVGQWMRKRAEAVESDKSERLEEIPRRTFTFTRGRKRHDVEGRLTQATLEALQIVSGLFGVVEMLGPTHVAKVVATLRGSSGKIWPPKHDPSGGAVQNFSVLKGAMAANPDTFWPFDGALDDVLAATSQRIEIEAFVIPVTWGPGSGSYAPD